MLQILKPLWLPTLFSFILAINLTSCKEEDPYTKYDRQQRELEESYIKKYLADNNITTFTKTASGLYYIPQQPGTGVKAQSGNTITMHYICKFSNGQKYESTYDTGIPKVFKVGQGREMKGLDEGATLLTKDEKATLILPSRLADGRNVLLFDVTVMDIK